MTVDRDRIVVATDATKTSENALLWAADRAAAQDRGLTLLLVEDTDPGRPADDLLESIERSHDIRARQMDSTVARLHERHSSLDIDVSILHGDPRALLSEASRLTHLLVIGTRGTGLLRSVLFAGVADAVITEGEGAIAVISENDTIDSHGPVVVGVDGSPESRAAARFALAEGQRTGVPVIAVSGWNPAVAQHSIPHTVLPVVELPFEEAAADALAKTLEPLLSDFPDVRVERRVEYGPPIPLLLAAAETASMLVVGSRGRGRVAGVLLGSTSRSLAQEARCPVIVVRDEAA